MQTVDILHGRGEWANTLTHLLGTGLALGALVAMVHAGLRHGGPRYVIGAAVFGTTLVLLYLMSTLYHALRGERVKRVFRILDHSAIYLLIAGTYTPFCLVTLRGPWGWSILGAIWGLACLGVLFKVALGTRLPWVSLALYLGMGWLVVVAAVPLVRALAPQGLLWLLAGGFCYTGGVAFYVWKSLRFHHALWHLFVLGGSACHVVAVAGWVLR